MIGHVVEQHRPLPADVAPGPVGILPILPGKPDDAWMAGIAREWAEELNDPREDLYSAEDGEPIDGAR